MLMYFAMLTFLSHLFINQLNNVWHIDIEMDSKNVIFLKTKY
jgi:hypothetical protein